MAFPCCWLRQESLHSLFTVTLSYRASRIPLACFRGLPDPDLAGVVGSGVSGHP